MSSLTGITTGAQLSAAIAAIAASSPGKIGQFLAFDALNYSNVYMLNGNTTALTPIEHFVQYGAASMAMPNKTFDPAYYKSHYADLSGTSMDAADLLIHFLKFGLDEGRAPNATLANTFNGTAYLAAYPAVATYVNANLASFGGSADNGALAHYVKFGQYQGFTLPVGATAGTTFNLAEGTTLGLKTMLITGDQDVRIDMTDSTRQITGLDLNGNGAIANDGKENALNVKPASGYVAVDAYTRLDNGVVNEKNLSKVFLGDIAYDGTGFAGDGVKTNGNIVLGGLGADTILGGTGNDFLAGGGVALSRGTGRDVLSGGRNADFLFAELSLLTNTDGNNTLIDGGSTADNTSAATGQSAQDTDWLLVQASDDDEPVTINLTEDVDSANPNTVTGSIYTRAGQTATLKDIENVDASGNFYDFLKGLTTAIGGAPTGATNPNNNGIGSSAQLRINGSLAANKLIGGYDNDVINGGAGNDLLMGGNLNYLINPNLVGLVNGNDGKDTLNGDAGNDNIVFEADTGAIDGGADTDTLWLTAKTLGNNTAAQVLADGVIRIDLLAQSLANAAGYGGANVDGTQDQTNYAGLAGNGRVTLTNMESVTATGLGAIDYAAAGTNTPEIGFSNIQNIKAYAGNLDLRGSNVANTLYASTGADKLEGRQGDDNLSGGEGDDDFIFALAEGTGDGVDVIHRQADANGDNLWDGYNSITGTGGTFVQDFGQQSAVITANSKLTLTLTDSTNPADLTGFPVNGVAFKLDGVAYTVPLTSGVQGTYAAFTAGLNAALDANPALAALDAVLNANNTITITDPAGKTFVSTGYTFVGNVVPPAGTLTWNQNVGGPTTSQTLDRLIYQSYADRADGEKTHDDAVVGSTISLGVDSYAQDLVVSFGADGTRIAEDQSYTIAFTNLTTRDKVSIAVNGVTYSLQVGVDLDGNAISNEDVAQTAQATIQTNFVERLKDFIVSFMDNDTAAGQVTATRAGDTLTLTQVTYAGEQTVFMTAPVVTLTNLSNGEAPSRVITNTSQHEVLLYNFDGRNGNLSKDNVLFLGDTDANRSNLVTAKTAGGAIAGTEAVLVDGGVDDLAGIALNTANNGPLQAAGVNFSVHGDDFLIGGDGADTITAGTGDDRVQGSKGADVLDGGKNYYAVKVLGETEARVLTWNVWEAANPASAQALAADPTLAGKTITSVTLIDQTESGTATKTGEFNDTLIYSQGDFVTGSTRFTIALNNYTVNGGVVSLNNGGAGSITVDLTGNGASADDSTSTFTNFENIRTVSGTGLAVAGVGGGQGNDTLNVAALSTDTGGISYNLTSSGLAGQVKYSTDAHANAGGVARPVAGDFDTLVINVDGVESVIGGTGDDLLLIDQTEAAKDNSFDGGGANVANGADRIEYQNVFSGVPATERLAQPVVTIKVGAAGSDVDTVTMTGGRVGTTVATDTLTSVEFITLANGTATSGKEADLLDASALVAGAVVNFNDGTVTSGGIKQVTVENLYQVETVKGSTGSDTVIVASAAAHGANTTSDLVGAAKDITIATFLDYNDLNASNARKPFATLTSAEITNVINEGQFKFMLGEGTADTVDYSLTTNDIAVRVELDAALPNQYVLVDSTVGGGFDAVVSAGDRIDVLTGVERIVAAQGESILDLTQSTKGLEVRYNSPVLADKVGNTATTNAYDVSSVRISDLSSASPLSRSYLELRDDPLVAAQAGTATNRATATWSRIEGSDNAERVILNSDHSLDATNTFNLRGGANEVKYNELTKSITLTLSVSDFVAATPLTTGIVTGVVTFQDGTGAGVVGPTLAGSGTHTITSYTANNGIAAGSLRIAASQDAEDNLALTGLSEKLFLVSEVGTIDNQITVKLGSGAAANSVVLTGFELISDSAQSNDVYDFGSLINAVAGLDFIDNAADHDTIKVSNDAKAFNGAGATEISLEALSTAVALAPAGFDFDVLDVTKVTDTAVTTLTGRTATAANENSQAGLLGANTFGTTDEVVFGKISNVVSALAFESVVFTNATVTENGTTYALNTTTNTVTAGAKSVALTNLTNTISFGGTVLEQTGNTFRADSGLNVTTGVTVTVTGTEATSITGGNGIDTITGAGGADTIRGGMGNDILDGGFVAPVAPIYTVTLAGVGSTSGAAASTMTVAGLVLTTAAVPVGPQVAVGADADQIGAAFAAQSLASWQAAIQTAGLTALQAATLTNVAYDGVTNALKFTFSTAADAALINAALINTAANSGATGTAVLGATETDTAVYAARAESADIFKFEATAALNGVDTINNFDGTDTLNFGAFFAATGGFIGTYGGSYDFAAANTFNVDGMIVRGYNKATLSASDFGVGKIVMADNGQQIFITTGDADGVADATVNSYNVYMVTDTDATAGITYEVTLIGTVNSAAEIATGSVLVAG